MKNFLLSLIPWKIIKANPIILYHSIGRNVFDRNIDHISVNTLNQQLVILKKYFRFVFIDEYIEAKDKKNLAVITIDDGYKNIIDEALEIFEYHNIPITIFINSSTFENKVFWRDKIRCIIENNSVDEFLKFSKLNIKKGKFYRESKSPKLNSKKIDFLLTEFLKKQKIKFRNLCFDNEKYLIKHSLVMYGNHTHSHYVLSSLDKDEQYEEIYKTYKFLKTKNINISNVFSIPFGGMETFNDDTVDIIKSLGYKAMLLSRNKLSLNNGFLIDRFILKNNINKIKSLYIKQKVNK